MAIESWRWAEAQWRRPVERVRAGRRLVPPTWPGDARVAVTISFDSDHETSALRDGITHPGRLSQGEYGARAAVPRILRLLDRYGVPATFFMPAVAALLHPDEPRSYVESGHEIGVHGWIHERNTLLDADAELDLTARSIDTLERLSGARPVGIRTPSWEFSEHTLDVIRKLGFRYDSSLMGDDEPYEIVADGAPTGIVELPVEWIRDDAPCLTMDRFGGLRPYTAPRELGRIWRDEFDQARQERGVFQLTLHPHVIGHRSRIVVLDELLDHITSFDDVWLATHEQVVEQVAAELGT
ncbi:MAG: polysaccharide deacetylase family protein [Streptosporangiales bacterium]|nr:polysaccharide deacetylase family protein [Streptosporangiales bacterium]